MRPTGVVGVETICPNCGATKDPARLFCACGKLLDREALESIDLKGEIGVRKFDQFWRSGDPNMIGA